VLKEVCTISLSWCCKKMTEIGTTAGEKKKEDAGKAAENYDRVVGKEGNGEGYVCRLTGRRLFNLPNQRIPDLKRTPFPASRSSTLSKRGVLIASTAVVLSIGLYITYKSRSRYPI